MRIEFSVLTRYTVDYPYEKSDLPTDENFDAAVEEIYKKTAEVIARSELIDTQVEDVSERHLR